jgi:hypothetical protein
MLSLINNFNFLFVISPFSFFYFIVSFISLLFINTIISYITQGKDETGDLVDDDSATQVEPTPQDPSLPPTVDEISIAKDGKVSFEPFYFNDIELDDGVVLRELTPVPPDDLAKRSNFFKKKKQEQKRKENFFWYLGVVSFFCTLIVLFGK